MSEYPGKLISVLYRKSQSYWTQVLKKYDISSAEYPVLMVLSNTEGIRQDEIASRLAIDKSAITRVIQSLEGKGFIERKKGEEDRRCNRIYLTEKGRASKTPIEQGKKEWTDILGKGLTEEELQQVTEILSKMVDNLKD